MLTITTQATDRSLLTGGEARAALAGAAASDTQVSELIARVSASLVRACKVAAAGAIPPTLRLERVSDTFRLKSHQSALVLSRRPVVEIVSVTESGTSLAQADYECDASAGVLQRLSGEAETRWPCGKVVVAYSAGWQTVPDDLKLAAAKLAAAFWSEGQKGDSGLKRVNIPGVIEKEWWVGPSNDPAIPQEVLDLLAPYMNHAIG